VFVCVFINERGCWQLAKHYENAAAAFCFDLALTKHMHQPWKYGSSKMTDICEMQKAYFASVLRIFGFDFFQCLMLFASFRANQSIERTDFAKEKAC
jgi:hypothetical protein